MSTATLLLLAASLRAEGSDGDSSGSFMARGAGPAFPVYLSGQGRAARGSARRHASWKAIAVLLLVLGIDAVQARTLASVRSPAPAPRIDGIPPGPCVEVEVAGHRAGNIDCATRQLEHAARSAQERARAGMEITVPGTGSADTQIGVASLSGSRLRMGNALGHSVHPQRPMRPVLPPRPGGVP